LTWQQNLQLRSKRALKTVWSKKNWLGYQKSRRDVGFWVKKEAVAWMEGLR